ncbi:hypothetical protein Zm00014a_006179 [Zea mays]|uniref:Uncharacterized protein n=1 Tax=Zea mays TaxID=4577 RepID=A0A3L6DUZ0_MAIZE|nr:hypothetical protein Zm00014a_006179 [Zea mays]
MNAPRHLQNIEQRIMEGSIDQQAVGCNKNEEYCIEKCVRVLESMEELTEEEMSAAMGVFKCEENREIFLNSQRPRVRLLWLRNEIDKQM